jgi:NADH-quinone oxidoreductase subunit N
VQRLSDDLIADLGGFVPELIICATIVGMLVVRLFTAARRTHMAVMALVCTIAALVVAVGMWPGLSSWSELVPSRGARYAFSNMVSFDLFGLYLRIFLLAFLAFLLWLSLLTGIPDREDSADYCTLVMGGILGMMLMVSSSHLLMAFIAVEMASLPSYALAGFLKGRRQGSEAALKYVIYGASASGVMLYGISLIVGNTGTGFLPDIATAIGSTGNGMTLPVVVGLICVLIGLAFKLSAVPFHFWCPDVFEGAPAEVGAFLSVASKAAALAMTTRVLIQLASAAAWSAEAIGIVWGVFAAVTATFGNLSALPQTNVKRLLAYSTIAHAGIMMMALIPMGSNAAGPVLLYVSAYFLMNLGAFSVVAIVRNRTGSEEIAAYRGLIHRSPTLAVGMSIFLLSLLGLPPLAGFAAKFEVFATLYEAGQKYTGEDAIFGWAFFGLFAIVALNTAISAGYYLKFVRTMVLDEAPEGGSPIRAGIGGNALVLLLAGMVLALGVLWGPVTKIGDRATHSFSKLEARQR